MQPRRLICLVLLVVLCALPAASVAAQTPQPPAGIATQPPESTSSLPLQTPETPVPGVQPPALHGAPTLDLGASKLHVEHGTTAVVQSAPESVTVEVSATTGWQSTGFSLQYGEYYTISYMGARWTVDYRYFPYVGPEGYDAATNQQIAQGCQYSSAWPYARLLGTIGSSGVFSVGQGGTFYAQASGTLYLRINDKDECMTDNDGYVRMEIRRAGGVNVTSVYSTDEYNNPKTTFEPGEMIRLWINFDNTTGYAAPVAFYWYTWNPSGDIVPELSEEGWEATVSAGAGWAWGEGTIPTASPGGAYMYEGGVLHNDAYSYDYTYFNVNATPPPSAEFDAWPLSGIAPLTVKMHIVSTANISSCEWDYGDGQTGTSCAGYHDHVYQRPGKYTVNLKVTGPTGLTNSVMRSDYITVNAPPPLTEQRDIVFVRGLTSVGDCDGMNAWVKGYFLSQTAKALFRQLSIDQYLNFSYAGGGDYMCPIAPGKPPAYSAADTCDGIDTAATELKAMIDAKAKHKVVIYGHSMGGIVAAYMVSTNRTWAKEKVAAVLTLDSPLQGIGEWEADWSQKFIFTACTYDKTAAHNSLAQLTQNNAVILSARAAANVVPFYHLNGTKLPDDAVLSRERVRLSNGRAFHLISQCGNGSANKPNCEPPLDVDDNHGETQGRRFDEQGIDKGPFFGCAGTAARDCAWISVPVSNIAATAEVASTEATAIPYTVPAGVTRMRFSSYFDQPVKMKLLAADGTAYGPDGQGAAAYELGSDYEIYEIANPAAGPWQVAFSAVGARPSTVILGTAVMEMQAPIVNAGPTAAVSVAEHNPVGQPISFSGTESYDPDGMIVRYEWDFDNNGVYDYSSTEPMATHVYYYVTVGTVALRVTDDRGAQDVTSAKVRVGDFLYLPYMSR